MASEYTGSENPVNWATLAKRVDVSSESSP